VGEDLLLLGGRLSLRESLALIGSEAGGVELGGVGRRHVESRGGSESSGKGKDRSSSKDGGHRGDGDSNPLEAQPHRGTMTSCSGLHKRVVCCCLARRHVHGGFSLVGMEIQRLLLSRDKISSHQKTLPTPRHVWHLSLLRKRPIVSPCPPHLQHS
jgi:hypothetical protein